eukprot:7511923-Karenia_brevis.AAC.1
MVQQGEDMMALFVVLAFTAYLRPQECLNLLVKDCQKPQPLILRHWSLLICPQDREETTKVGEQDDTVILDSSVTPWLGK